jgi:ferritin-like metal-binding protein YciE
MAGYITAISLAEQAHQQDVVTLLQASLQEERAADQKLRSIGSGLLKVAPSANAAHGD